MSSPNLRRLLLLIISAGTHAALAQPSSSPWQANAEVVQKRSKRVGFNYHESKVPKYTLPAALRTSDGDLVTSIEQWNDVRRPEILELFRTEVYGRRPETAYRLSFEQIEEQRGVFDGQATARSMKAHISIGTRMFSFPFVLFIPSSAKSPVPAIVHINNRYFVPMEKAIQEEDPFWPARTIIERGVATASFHTSDVDPDDKDGYADGIRAFFADGSPPNDEAWRSLSAWGWAASRVLDHLSECSEIDASRAAVVGHSRGGKTSLWAACEDPRFAIAYSNNSGCGGAALSRRRFGETVARITSSFPHWFCPRFSTYADNEQGLPIDQHQVMSLIAPRAIYVASADEDLWADPRGEYTSLVAAADVFRLHGRESITEKQMPALGKPRHVGATGYHVRPGGHNLGLVDWNHFLDFVETQFED